MGGCIVQHEAQVEVGRNTVVDQVQEAATIGRVVAVAQGAADLAAFTSMAANWLVYHFATQPDALADVRQKRCCSSRSVWRLVLNSGSTKTMFVSRTNTPRTEIGNVAKNLSKTRSAKLAAIQFSRI